MSSIRKNTLFQLAQKKEVNINSISEIENFASCVFNRSKMQRLITEKAYQQLEICIEKRSPIPAVLADQIASVMKTWALSMGATHFTHWVQPITGATAEKKDSFYYLDASGQHIEKFDGDQLVQKTSDATGYTGGSSRDTFESRGYTTWDPTSPAFIFDLTLCIPSTFVAYTGESLDYKTPLLKSTDQLDDIATQVCHYFDKNVNAVQPTLGWEQEYFLIDRSLIQSRPDLILTGRTLLGQSLLKGQQRIDSFFGTTPVRVGEFLKSLERECYRLGIPIKTRHNEVAPSQYEIAQVFESANLAVDHNTLLMALMHKVAYEHNFSVLFHEKPFEKINGSSKHSNWSLMTSTGVNLLSPGKNPTGNLQFLAFFVNTIAAVLKHEALLQASTVSASNDLRIGMDEAPSAMFSIFVGKYLMQVLEELEQVSKGKLSPEEKTDLKLNVIGKIPEILLDNTDRDRTSPFAFTGNKFEIRSVGSSANCAKTITVINAIVTQQLIEFKAAVDNLIDSKNMKKDDAIFNTLRETIKTIKEELLESGNVDSKKTKSKTKVINQHHSTPDALAAYLSASSVELFENLDVFSSKELNHRVEIDLKQYINTLHLEARSLCDLALNQVIPAAMRYQKHIIKNVGGLKEIYGPAFKGFAREQLKLIESISKDLVELQNCIEKTAVIFQNIDQAEDFSKKSKLCRDSLLPLTQQIRSHCDALEAIVEDSVWPLAKYRELLFIR